MNTRVLELIKNPKIITESDLSILESESEKMPYAQSIRALYLYGINLYKTENYKEHLSKTAAYTTDKKILYQFISSQKINQEPEILVTYAESQPVENQTTNAQNIIDKAEGNAPELQNSAPVLNKFDIERIIESEEANNTEFIVVEGERNRLLYEGEENFLQEKAQEIDLEATKESGIITVKDDLESTENLIVTDDNRSEQTISEHVNTEQVLEIPQLKTTELTTETQVQDEDSSGNISFNGIEDFLPQVKFSVPKNHLDYLNPPKKTTKKEKEIPQEKTFPKPKYSEPLQPETAEVEIDPSQISFEDTQAFDVIQTNAAATNESFSNQIIEQAAEDQINFEEIQSFSVPEEKISQSESPVSQPEKEAVSTWKPMSFSANTPDALIGKPREIEDVKTEIKIQENSATPEIIDEKIIDDKPVEEKQSPMAESEHTAEDVSVDAGESAHTDQKEIPAILDKVIEQELAADSNVGTFINTWQNWLKIDREKTGEAPEKTIVVKEKIIDQFIEKNPKISQLKDEVSFVVKEKKDDISHLMTETLAKLYVEQKLYSKAIRAYEILIEKHPQKKAYFQEKIEEVKDIRKS